MNNIRLNKYIAHSGYCSRRKADFYIQIGTVKVNNITISEPGCSILITDNVSVNGIQISPPSSDFIYILLNKPLNYITSSKDPFNRKIVLDLISISSNYRIFSVGRLDRNTTGLLLLTNDGLLSYKLTHPSFQIQKTYSLTLDKSFSKSHFHILLNGISLNDGIFHFDSILFPNTSNYKKLIVTLHSGKNRIIRRSFYSLHYNVSFLSRISFAGLDINDLNIGKWRYLNSSEIFNLKNITS